ncbi:MAG TPA: hypothetical protein VGH87_18815 [Polyangiaceae bacterium]|jgi:hypothetical protein
MNAFVAFVGASVVAGIAGYASRARIARLFAPSAAPRGLMPTPIAKLVPGVLVDTTGIVVSEKHEAPLGAPLCAFHRVRVTDGAGAIVFESQSHDDLVLDDGSGMRLVVSLDHAEWRLPEHHRDLASPDEELAAYLRERGVEARGDLRAVVTWIAPRDVVFVRGRVHEAEASTPADYRVSEAPTLMHMTATVIGLEPLVR